jgi:hypothetical protein
VHLKLKTVIAAGAVLAGASAVAAVLINLAVFASWGLDYLQVAGVGDVATAAAGVLVRALPALALTAVALFWAGPRRGLAATVTTLLLAGGAAYALVGLPAQAAARDGFYGKGDWVIDGGTGGCAVARVFWTGQNAVVYQCVATGPRRFRVSFDRGSMTLLPAAQTGELVHRM